MLSFFQRLRFILFFFFIASAALPPEAQAIPQRLAPPAGLPCSRNELTSYAGKILRYTRQSQQIVLHVRTDEATTEHFLIRIAKKKNYLDLFLLNGQAITKTELARVEKKLAQKNSAVRVIVWECRNTTHRVIDWRAELP